MISTIIYACKAKKHKFLFLLYYPLYSIDTVMERSEIPIVSTKPSSTFKRVDKEEQKLRDIFSVLPDEVIQSIIKNYASNYTTNNEV